MNIRLETYQNLTRLTILNANFHSYQLNSYNCLSDIKLFCCRFNASEGKLFLFCFPAKLARRQIGLPTNLSRQIVA